MIEIALNELDLELEVVEAPDFSLELDESIEGVSLQGPIDFGLPETSVQNHGYIDLDLIGFPYYGLSAYEIALKNGFIGSEAQWLESLKGVDGELGQDGKDAVNEAKTAAQAAAGSAEAASGFVTEAQAWSTQAEQYAESTQNLYTEALTVRDQTGQYAEAASQIYQQSEAILTDVQSEATAVQIARVAAETALAGAEASETRTAQSMTTAQAASASASENAIMAVEARNQADDRAEAAILAQSAASASADEARADADTAHKAQLIATAARDETNVIAQGVVVEVEQAHAWATDAETYADAAKDSEVAAEVSMGTAQTAASASAAARDQAEAHSTQSGVYANAASDSNISASNYAGQADISRAAAVQAATDAQGYRNSAQDYYNLTVTLHTQTGEQAAAAVTARNEAQAFANTAGTIYSTLASRVDAVEVNTGIATGKAETALSASADAQGKVNTIWSVNLNSNNRIVGLRYANDGTTTTFDIEAQYFRVWNGNTNVPAFEVSDNQLYVAGQLVRTQSIVQQAVFSPAIASSAASLTRPVNNVTIIEISISMAIGQTADISFSCDVGYPSVRNGITFSLNVALPSGPSMNVTSTTNSYDGEDRVSMNIPWLYTATEAGVHRFWVWVYGTRLINNEVDCTLYNRVLKVNLVKV